MARDDSDRSVHVVGTGGTIANFTGDYDSPENFFDVDSLIKEAPEEITSYASLSLTEVTHLRSGALTPSVWFELHEEIMAQARSDDPPDGFVVTHGSNTAEETAYFLNLTLNTDIPVVVTAAQRNIGALGAEGFKNLYDAVRVSTDSAAQGRGVMLVANEEIHHARDVSKLVAARPDAWCSPNAGRIGDAGEAVEFYRTPDRPSTTDTEFDLEERDVGEFPLTDIYITYSALAADGTMVGAAVENDAAGIVVTTFATGSPAHPYGMDQQAEAMHEAVERGVPVVTCHRGLEGYKLRDNPFVNGQTLRPQKARILLGLGLMETTNHDELEELFRTY